VDEYDPERDGELLRSGAVLKLLGLRSRTSLGEWRERGDLIGYRMRSGHFLYPANQEALNEARTFLVPHRMPETAEKAARRRALQRRQLKPEERR
jgi:hypothetical protein